MLLSLSAPPRQRSCQPSCGMSFIRLSPRAPWVHPAGRWGTPVTFASGAVWGCPQGLFVTANAPVGCGGGGEGLWVFLPAGLGVGSVCRVPCKASALRCRAVLEPRDSSPLTGSSSSLPWSPDTAAQTHRRSGGIPSAGFARAEGG